MQLGKREFELKYVSCGDDKNFSGNYKKMNPFKDMA